MSKKILVAGAGLIGRTIAEGLSAVFDVTSSDLNSASLDKLKKEKINTLKADLSDASVLKEVTAGFDVVVGALPGRAGFSFLKNCISFGKNVVDISFCIQDPMELNRDAEENNVSVAFDCGIAPGLSNIILGYENSKMKVNTFKCFVGGLPLKPVPPFNYKAPFSPYDVIEEYLRPARIVEDGVHKVKPAMSDPENVRFGDIGPLEAFNTDGLRSLLRTMKIPNMYEKTLRYPGHREIILALKDSGMFRTEPVEVDGNKIRPIDLTAKILAGQWKLEEGEEEFTAMRIVIEGMKSVKECRVEYELVDRYDKVTGNSSMARCTGFMCNAVVNLMASGKLQKGVVPPEHIGSDEKSFEFIIEYLKERNIKIRRLEMFPY